jgi:hypothetical protein
MTSQQKLILGGGAVAAYLIYRSRAAQATLPGGRPLTKRPGLLSTLFPTLGTNSPYVTSTRMAQGSGTGYARVPSSGLGYGSTSRGVAQPPSTIGGIAQGAGDFFKGLFGFLASRQPTATATAPLDKKPQASSGGSVGAGSAGSTGSSSAGRTATLGGNVGVAGQQFQNGYFDDNGNWHGYDGYYDANGNWVPTDAEGNVLDTTGSMFFGTGIDNMTGPDPTAATGITDAASLGLPITPIEPLPGAIDENGIFDLNAVVGVELLPATNTVSGFGLPESPVESNPNDTLVYTSPSPIDNTLNPDFAVTGIDPAQYETVGPPLPAEFQDVGTGDILPSDLSGFDTYGGGGGTDYGGGGGTDYNTFSDETV